MDPYILSRIGDVTIQRVLPKQDTSKPETTTEVVTPQTGDTGSPALELDLSMKNRSSKDKGEDEGGGGRLEEGNKESDFSDASEDESDISEELDDEDEQDVPLSLVTTKRNRDSDTSNNYSSVVNIEVNKGLEGVKNTQESKPMDFCEAGSSKQQEIQREDNSADGTDDDDMPLSRLIAESENMDELSDADGEFDVSDDKIPETLKKICEGGFEDSIEPEEEMNEEGADDDDEAENLVKGDLEQQEGERNPEQEEDPDREMIVVKQEVFEEGEEESGAKRKMSGEEDDGEGEDTNSKKKKDSGSGSDSGNEDDSQSGIDKKDAEKKLMNLRKNIREVMDETQLDEATLNAQRQEMERLRRVQEQQRIIREVNRQINLNRQNSKTQTRVISLLQGGGTSLLKASPATAASPAKNTSPNTVLVKLSSGSGPPQVVNKKVLEILRSTKSAANTGTTSKASALANKLLNKPHSLTPSVSIAPVKPGLTISKVGKALAEDDKGAMKKLGAKVKKEKGKDVVMISSSSSDEDDCILISEGEEEEEEEEDPTNSGMHTNDLYNVPDDQGRVLINVGRPENEPEVFLAPQIARIIKPHQIGGVRFLFDNVVESLERFKTSTGFGCILAHSMGLGKTLQVVSFCDVFLRYTEGKTVLCIMPINTLQNWLSEFNMWLPVDPSSSPFAAQGDVQPRTFPLFVLNDMQKSMVARAKVVIQWAKEGGVLLIGYELYRQLSLQKARKRRVERKRKLNPDDDIDDEKNKHLLEEMHAALVKPGPDLVICDEGHRIKNSHASISQALKQIRSKRRVVLTGYPLQNNLLEYWCMVDFVRPNYLGTKTEFSNMFERPIQNGQCIDSTPQDIRLMRYRAHVLHSLLEGFVQRRSHSVLTNALPQKEEYVILVRMTTFQRKLYDTFMNEVVRTKAVPNPLKAFAVCCKIWNHPDVLYHFLKKRSSEAEEVDLDLEEAAAALAATPAMAPGTPGCNIAPVAPTKRGRGRSPKGTSPNKRERKVNPRKRGGAEPDTPIKSPMVAAVMPNTTNSNQQLMDQSPFSSHSQSQQSLDVKPQPTFPQQPNSQFRPNFPYNNSNNNQFPPSYSGMNQSYSSFNPQQGDFHNMPPPYPGFHNQQGFNNQNMYGSGFGSSYYPSQQDPSFGGSSYWNNQFFNNDPNNSMFQNFNEGDSNNPNFYNQDMMGMDGFNPGSRGGYNSGMGVNRPGMSNMNTMQPGRMGMNNSSYGMMGMNSGMNNMGMPGGLNSMSSSSSMTMNQNNYSMNQMGSVGMGQGMGVNSQGMPGMSMGQSSLGMNPQSQSMGMNMGVMGSQNYNTMNLPSTQSHMGGMNMPSMSQSNPISSGMSSQNPSSGSLHTMTNSQVNLMNNTSNQSSMESQQQAAIENIANNLMMSSQQSLQGPQGLLGGGENNVGNHNNPSTPQNPQNLMNQHHSSSLLGDMLGSSQNQSSGLGNVHQVPQPQASPAPNQTSTLNTQNQGMTPSQSSHMMANMISSPSNPQNITNQQHGSPHLGPLPGMGSSSLDDQNVIGGSRLSQTMMGNAPSSTVTSSQQNVGSMQNQQGFLGNQSNSSGMMDNMQNSMFRNQTSNPNLFGQQSSLMGNNQGMFSSTSQTLGSSQTSMNQNMVHSQQNISGSGNIPGFDQTNSQNLMTNQQTNMMTAQDPGMSGTGSMQSSMSSQQSQPDSHNNPLNQPMFGNQPASNNPMGNLQSMINNQNMMSSPGAPQNVMQNKRQSDNLSGAQQRVQGSQSGMMINHPSRMNESMMGPNVHANQQHSMSAPSGLMDNSQQMFGMNQNTPINPIGQSGFMNNQNIMGPGLGSSSNVMSNQNMMGSQSMGMGMNSSQGMYGNQINQNELMGGNSGMMSNQFNSQPFNSHQMAGGNNMMGMHNQPGMMNYPGLMGNQMNNTGMMNQSNMSSSSMINQNQTFGSNMMRNPSPMMGMRNPQPVTDMNQGGISSNFSNSQNNFGMFNSSSATPSSSSSFNNPSQNSQTSKGQNSFPSTTSSSLFMSGGEFHTTTSQSDSGSLTQNNLNNDYNNYGLNNEDQKIWDDLASKCGDKPTEAKTESEEVTKESKTVKKETDVHNQDNKMKLEDVKSSMNLKSEEDAGSEKKESDKISKEETKSPKAEGNEKEVKEPSVDTTSTTVAATTKSAREEAGIPYDWATELLKDYTPGNIEASAKFALFFCILEESMSLGDRVLVFSQSLFTLNLIEDFLQRTELPGRQERWARNWNYYRLDGSTGAMEREKLINEFNSNPNIHLFLVSTRAGSLGINLVGANRVVVLDASWNPCHDTQAVCRVYRYGQRKPCFVYRLVTDNCLEKKIYDRQINKQGMADRVVDECNPDAHLSIKEVTNLCWDNEQDSDAKDFSDIKDKYIDVVMQKMLERYSKFLSKEPFQHESLLVDRKDKKLSQAEKRLAKRSYELEKQAATNNTRPTYGYYPGNTSGVGRGNPLMKPMASVRPMQAELNNQLIRDATSGRPRQWIPAEVWQKQGMSAQEMTLPLDVVIPTNSPDRSSIVLKAGQKVMVLKSPKGIYMQLENGKIIAIRTAFKVGGKGEKKGVATKETPDGVKKMVVQPTRQRAPASLLPLRNNSNISIIPRGGAPSPRGPNKPLMRMLGNNRAGAQKQPIATAKPYFGEGSAHPPVTVTVTKKKIGVNQTPSTSTAQVEVRREPKQVTVTPIPPPSPKKTETATSQPPRLAADEAATEGSSKYDGSGGSEHSESLSESQPSPGQSSVIDEF